MAEQDGGVCYNHKKSAYTRSAVAVTFVAGFVRAGHLDLESRNLWLCNFYRIRAVAVPHVLVNLVLQFFLAVGGVRMFSNLRK